MKLPWRRTEAELRERIERLEQGLAARTRELEARSGRLRRVAALARTVAAAPDREAVLDAVVEGARELLAVALAGLWVADPATGDIERAAVSSASDDPVSLEGAPTRLAKGQGWIGWAVEQRRPCYSHALAEEPLRPFAEWATRERLASELAVPLVRGEQALGALVVSARQRRVFTPEEEDLLATLAAEAALAIENARLLEAERAAQERLAPAIALDRTNMLRALKTRLTETETLLTVSQAVSSTLDTTEMMRRVARESALALGADMGGAYLADADQQFLRPIAGWHVPKHLFERFMSFPIPLKGHAALEEAWQRGAPAWSSDAGNDPRIDRATWERFPHRANVFLPMVSKGEPIGGLFLIWWSDPHHCAEEELRLAEGISRLAAVALDNARLYERQKEILERLRLFAQTARAIGESVVITDLERRIIFVNETFILKYGWKEAEVLGQPVSFLPAPSTPTEVLREIDRRTREGGWQGELRHRKKSGEEIPVLLTTAPVRDESGRLVALVGVSRDLSQEKFLGAQLAQAEKLAAVGQLAAGIAHEINNPLTAIVGFSSLALERNLPRDVVEELEVVRAQAIRAAQIVRDLLTFARPSPENQVAVDLNEVLHQTARLQEYHLATDQIEVVWKLAESLPKTLGDRGQLQQVILNLVVNAHHAMKAAHGRGRLTIETGRDGNEIWARVRDDGPGIPPALLPRIFEPFLTTKPVGQGTGLGLSISYSIVKAHGGSLLAGSAPEGGAVFTVVLPAMETAPDETDEPSAPPPRRGGSLSVLVVDDEPPVARVLSAMLERLGHRPQVAHSGQEALALLRRNTYDLMTLDLRMPHMSGQEVWRHLQAMNLRRPPRVLFVTGDIAPKGATAFLAESGHPYLEKPFQPSELAQKLDELFSEGGAAPRPNLPPG
jgi:two-component system NtrC family sensor kinase